MTTIRISKEVRELLHNYSIERFRCEFEFISKDHLLKTLFKENYTFNKDIEVIKKINMSEKASNEKPESFIKKIQRLSSLKKEPLKDK